jgi:hypothetical protein
MDEITPHKSNPKPTFGLSSLSLLMSPQNHQKGNLMFTFAKSDIMYFIQSQSTNRHKVLGQSAKNLPTCAKEGKHMGNTTPRYKTQHSLLPRKVFLTKPILSLKKTCLPRGRALVRISATCSSVEMYCN